MPLTPPWDLVPQVNRNTFLFPQQTMDALVEYLGENLPGASPEDIAQAVEDFFAANPIQIADVEGLQSALDSKLAYQPMTEAEYQALPVKDPNTLYVTNG